MRCAKCGTNNPSSNNFCARCGNALTQRCAKCSAENPPASNFCGKCGAALSGSGSSAGTASEAEGAPIVRVVSEPADASLALDGERKTVTALFADIKGSTEMMEELDPEQARAIIDPALRLMIDAAHRYDGYVVQSTGDGIFALFGAPVAHEDHPQRALYAALRMQEDLKRYSDHTRAEGRLPIQVRVGVNTGEVVVRSIKTDEAHSEYTPIGHSTSLAARMQALAPIGSIATTEQVRKLCEGYFAFKALGPTKVKGVAEPVNVYEVTGFGPLRTRLQRSASRGYTKFVGRQREMEAMTAAAEQAMAGHGQIVAAVAEPGVGKSRLFYEFKVKNQSGWMVLQAFSVSYGKATAYLPVLDLLHSYFGIEPGDDARRRREKVTGKVITLDRALENALPYLFGLLGIVDGDDALAQMDAQIRRRRTLEAIKRILLRESLNQPLTVIFEDLHWIDEQTQEFLNLLADSIGTGKILLLVNYRPEYSHQWNSKTYYTQLRLDPLGRESAEEMLTSLLGDRDDLAALKRLIIERTEGTPFFMEETVQVLLDDGALVRNGTLRLARPLAELKIPPTVQAILASRIDRLPPDAKDLLQTLAVLGREFPTSLIRAVVTKSDEELHRTLHDLQVGEFIYEQPAVGDIEYTFKHALTQEVAYHSVLVERRKLLHQRAGEGIEVLFAEQLDDHLNELARHYSHSPNIGKAVKYLHLAGQQAAQRSAYAEAVGHFTNGLELLNRLPDDRERARRELELQLSLAESLTWTNGMGSLETGRALVRARDICTLVGERTELFTVLQGLEWHNEFRLQLENARDLGEQLFTLAESANEPAKLMAAHNALGLVFLLQGEFTAARDHFDQASPRFDWGQSGFFGAFYPCFGAWALWALGYADQALKWSREALASAEALSRPAPLANALSLVAVLHMFLRDPRMAHERAEAAIAIAAEQGFPFELAFGTLARGWALAKKGHLEGIAEMRRAVTAGEDTGFAARPRWFAFLAEACAKSEGPGAGLKLLAEGLGLMEATGERMYEAELHRLKGELLLMQSAGNTVDAESCFRTAIEVARRQAAKSLELRATVSLARLLRDTDRPDDARAMLADIYGWFTEGFDTADLKDAKALLEEMRS
jgi:class 3 adenylate cyclase/tetratricopeptide (TPR) repeat protein